MKFTVVVTVFQREHLIPRILHGLASQTHEDWDAIFISDGPHTEAKKSVLTFAVNTGLAIRWTTGSRRPGVFGNHLRRQGLEAATGDYVCFVGHDCLIDPEYLANHKRAIYSHLEDILSVVQCRYWTLRDPKTGVKMGTELYQGLLPPTGESPEKFQHGSVDLTSMAFPRDAALEHGVFSHDLMRKYGADWWSFDKCRKHLLVVFTPGVVCAHF